MAKIDNFAAWKNRITESKTENIEDLNEGFLSGIVDFFKGIFNLFSDKKVKEAAENQSKRFKSIEDDEDIDDSEVEGEIDIKRTRRTNSNMTSSIKDRVKANAKAGVKGTKMLTSELASWFGMIIVQEESIRMPIIDKMLKDPETSKRFVYVPTKWRANIKDWYKQKECVLDKAIAQAILKTVQAPQKDKKTAIEKLASLYVAQSIKPEDKAKSNDSKFLNDILNGYSTMINGIVNTMTVIIDKTPDDKLQEVIAKDIVKVRATKKSASPKKSEKKKDTSHPDDENAGAERSGRRIKKDAKGTEKGTEKVTKKETATV